MKVLFVSVHFQPAWAWGGTITANWNMLRGVARAGAEVTVVTTDAEPAGRLDVSPRRHQDGVEIVTEPIACGGRWGAANRHGVSPRFMARAAALMPRADLVHFDGFWGPALPPLFCWCRAWRKPYVITPHGNLEQYSLEQKRLKKTLFLNVVARPHLLGAAALHYTTLQEEHGSPAWLRPVPTMIVPNAVQIPHDGQRARARQRLGLCDDEVVLGMVGRIHQKKGFNIILPALARARPAGPVRLLVVGPDEGGYQDQVRQLIASNGLGDRVTFTGLITGQDLADTYAGLDLLVLPSYEENFGMVVVEAVAQGTPVAVSEPVGLQHWVAERDVGQVLPLDEDAWVELLQGLTPAGLASRWDRGSLGVEARERFSPAAVGQQMLEQYQRILER